jgi:transposase InsO family protein
MPWEERQTVLHQRREFCVLAAAADANFAELCRRYHISRKTGYKWRKRFKQDGAGGLVDQSRRPARSPGKIEPAVEQQIVCLRQERTAWGGRKLRRRLQDLGRGNVPAASTIQRVIRRNGLHEVGRPAGKPFVRFEHPRPNDLWQMDFKGHFAMSTGRCHPLTILDDHSRFCLGLRGCDDQRACTVRAELERVFDTYGLPRRILCDNGSPWGDDTDSPHTHLTIWMLRLGVGVCHGRPYHPQTQGKDERFHRTIKAELLGTRAFIDAAHFQALADGWRDDYNLIRPHEALGLATPASRYCPATRPMPRVLPPIEYDSTDDVRKVDKQGWISYKARYHKIGRAFAGQPVALRPSDNQGGVAIFFSHHKIKTLDPRAGGD